MFVASAEWPKKTEVQHSVSVTVSLIPTSEGFTPVAETPGQIVVTGVPSSPGTPEAPLSEAFGPGYRAEARAVLSAAAFTKDPEEQKYQRLERRKLTWSWTIVSGEPGRQALSVAIEVRWLPTLNGEPAVEGEEVWDHEFEIEVAKPFLTLGQLQLSTFLSGFIGSALTVPFLYGLIRERWKKK
jgi:hypothetical protein